MKLLITAGPTREPIDAVRFIGNRSSGRMGLAIARAGADAGCEVTLLLGGGVDASGLGGVTMVRFETTDELAQLLGEYFPAADVLVMAAAVADYRPARVVAGKIARTDSGLMLSLEPTPDLVAAVAAQRRADQRVIGFALEPRDQLDRRAADKCKRKQLDAIIANPLETLDSDAVEPAWLDACGCVVRPGAMTKADFGRWLIDKVVSQYGL